jgi:polyisoprenyl-teichoic acid--peptidoglycan teichoic acid transferase
VTPRSPNIAALLSFLFPGLGQAYAGYPRRGLLMALPMIFAVVLALFALTGGTTRLLELLVGFETLLALLILNLALFAYRLAAIFDAFTLARDAGRRRARSGTGSPVLLAGLVALSLVIQGVPEYLGARTLLFLDDRVQPPGPVIPSPSFDPEPTPEPTPTPLPTPSPSPSPTLAPGQTPTPTPRVRPCPPVQGGFASDGRLNLLLIGADSGPGRTSIRTDTMILLSVELETCRAALLGFPRNMTPVPLPAESRHFYGDRFPDEMLNAVWRRAYEHPERFYGEGLTDEQRAWRAVIGTIQELAGVPIDGMVAVDLNGFVRLVDAVGGLWIDVPRRLRDTNYPREDGSGRVGIDIRRGCQLLEGWEALAYARSRQQDDDYQRMGRQQLVLTSLRRQLDPLALLPHVNTLFDIAGDNLWLYVDRNDIPQLARVAAAVDADRIQTITFTPPRYASPLDNATLREIRRAVRNVFDNPDPTPRPEPTGSPRPECPPPGGVVQELDD